MTVSDTLPDGPAIMGGTSPRYHGHLEFSGASAGMSAITESLGG
jgi:hypothetical protein